MPQLVEVCGADLIAEILFVAFGVFPEILHKNPDARQGVRAGFIDQGSAFEEPEDVFVKTVIRRGLAFVGNRAVFPYLSPFRAIP